MTAPKVYLAGPDVFRPGWRSRIPALKALAAARGLAALVPGDGGPGGAAAIAAENLAMIAEARCVVANLEPFRGEEPDSGTAFECGYARGLGKPVVGYLPDLRSMLEKARERPGGPGPDSDRRLDGTLVEDFGLPLNLMLAATADRLVPTLEAALDRAAVLTGARPGPASGEAGAAPARGEPQAGPEDGR
jgi:nucleoside 2-deoxyribosyltransferase